MRQTTLTGRLLHVTSVGSTVAALMLAAGTPRADANTDPLPSLLALSCHIATDGSTICTSSAPVWNRDDLTMSAVVAVYPAATHVIRIVDVDARAAMRDLFVDGPCATAPAVIIGGYFGREPGGEPYPLGLVIADGVETDPWLDWRVGGALVVDTDRNTAIRYWRDLSDANRADLVQALQSKPILVYANRNDGIANNIDRADRVAFAIADTGDLILIAVTGPFIGGWQAGLTIRQFADFIAALRLPDGAVVDRAINLDGGPSAHLYLRAEDLFVGAPLERYVPNVVCVEER